MSRELFRKSTLGSQHTVTNGAPNYERYEYLASAFYNDELYRIFAKPIILGRDEYGRPTMIRWMTDYDFTGDPVALPDLPAAEQEIVKGKVKNNIDQLYREAARHARGDAELRDLTNILDNCIEVPDDTAINIIKVPDASGRPVDKYVLTQWGFISDDRKAATGIIKRWTGLRVRNIRIRAVYPDGAPAAGERFYIEYGAISKELRTDANGTIALDEVPANVSIHTYQIFDDTKQHINNLYTDDRTEYAITIPRPVRKADLTILIRDHDNKPVPAITVNLQYAGMSTSVPADANGQVLLKAIPAATPITLAIPAGKDMARFTIVSDPARPTETIQLPPPEKPTLPDPPEIPRSGPVTLQFIDWTKKPVANVPVELTYNGKKYPARTDTTGKILLKDTPFNRSIDIRVSHGRRYYKGSVVHVADKESHVLELKKRSLWWLWLLLALLALWLLLFLPRMLHPVHPVNPGGGDSASSPAPAVPANTLLIHVIDADTKEDIARASVQLNLSSLNGQTDNAGKLSFSNISNGTTANATVSLLYYDTASQVVTSGQENRIYLKPAVKSVEREDTVTHLLGHTSVFIWDLGENAREFYLTYNMDSIPDQLEIFCGKGTTGQKIFWTASDSNPDVPAPVQYGKEGVKVINQCGSRYVTVKVVGSDTRTPDGLNYATQWWYTLYSPKMR